MQEIGLFGADRNDVESGQVHEVVGVSCVERRVGGECGGSYEEVDLAAARFAAGRVTDANTRAYARAAATSNGNA